MEKHVIIITVFMIISMKEICECCFERERNGLLQIKSSFNQNLPNMLSSWDTLDANCCNWEGVNCNSTTGHVTGLQLSGGIITGSTDSVLNWYLNASLFLSFPQLNQLSLKANNISGCLHNEGFEKLSILHNLEILDLSYNNFNNSILQSLSDLPSLKTLYFSYNQLNETINISELNNPTSTLQVLDFSWNEIERFETVQVKFTKLEYLGLAGNHFNSSTLFSLSELSSLNTLDLAYNNFKGPFNFRELNGLSNLQALFLCGNQITNFVIAPKGGEGFNRLENLDLSYNQFNQTTSAFFRSIGKISSLKALVLIESGLNGNVLSGSCHLKNLQSLQLHGNDLNGNLPGCWANLTSLQYLDLSENQFSGMISVSPLTSLTSLEFLDLSDNLFEIPISLTAFFNLSQLIDLYVSNNTIHAATEDHNLNPKFQLKIVSLYGYGDGGALPKFLYHQRNLQRVYISSIKLRGGFPYWLLQNNTRLNTLDLSNTSLTMNLMLPNNPHISLSYLDISDNFISGNVPSQIGVYFPSLKVLSMSINELNGSIPNSVCNIKALYFFDISQNKIFGTIPNCIENLSQLYGLDLSNNNISGNLPSNLGHPNLILVNLSKNRLQGSLKNTFHSCTGLFLLDLSHNNFSGSIPSWIGGLSELSFFLLGHNSFQREIPIELCKLKQLSFIDLSHNNIVGDMLPCLNFNSYWSRVKSSIRKIEHIEVIMKGRVYNYKQKVVSYIGYIEITMKGWTYVYEENVLSYLSGMDMSCNSLTGKIPLALGNLSYIKVMNFSHNSLSGRIPSTFSNLKEIESLDLSHNNLQGTIPHQLSVLTRLAVFNVSYNNLSGPTPNQVAQFATFDESSYRGNPFLCGWPLLKSCNTPYSPPSNATVSPNDDESSYRFIDMDDFFVSFGVAYATVLITLVTVLCINQYWRRVWFYYVHMSIDRTYYFIIDNVIPLVSVF